MINRTEFYLSFFDENGDFTWPEGTEEREQKAGFLFADTVITTLDMVIDFAKNTIECKDKDDPDDRPLESEKIRKRFEDYKICFSTLTPEQKVMVLKLVKHVSYSLLCVLMNELDGLEEGGQYNIKMSVPSVDKEEYSIQIAPDKKTLRERLPEWVSELSTNAADLTALENEV